MDIECVDELTGKTVLIDIDVWLDRFHENQKNEETDEETDEETGEETGDSED